MSNRPQGFGLTAELNRKKAAKFDQTLATDCLTWIQEVLRHGGCDDQIRTEVSTEKEFGDVLKDGIILCKVINIIDNKKATKFSKNPKAFQKMENINLYLKACEDFGCKKIDLFQTVDLSECQNIPQVINGIMALGRKVKNINPDMPALGPTESTENKREFTDEQLRASEGIIGLQAGSNKGASQSGQSFGKTRSIID